MLWKIQYTRGRGPFGGDSADLPWADMPGHDHYTSEEEATRAASDLDADHDYQFTHQAVAVESEAA